MLSDADYRVLVRFKDSLPRRCPRADPRLQALIDKDFIRAAIKTEWVHEPDGRPVETTYRTAAITLKGVDALLEFEQVAHDKAEDKREKRFDRKFQVVLLFVSFLLGLLTEHFTAVISFALGLFH